MGSMGIERAERTDVINHAIAAVFQSKQAAIEIPETDRPFVTRHR
jgi:hypothetical protein